MAYEELKSSGITADTPKNIMLRAIKINGFNKNSAAAKKLWTEYETAKSFLLGSDKTR